MLVGSEENTTSNEVRRRYQEVRRQVLTKYTHRAEERDKSKSSEMSEKDFDNLNEEALSPRTRSPMFDSKKLEMMEKELAADRTRLHNTFGRMFFYLNCIFGIKYFFLLPLKLVHNGGWYFLFPLLVCFFVLALPLVFLELILGQFTSQLGSLVFSRIAPIAVGIGFAFPCLRVLLMVYFKTEHRNVSLLWDMIQKVFFRERNVVCWRENATDCFLPDVCEANEVFFQGGCYNRELLWKTRQITSEQNVRLAVHGLFQKEKFYGDAYVKPIAHVDRIMNADVLAHKLDATITFFVVAFLLSLLGVRRFAKILPFVHALVGLSLLGISIAMMASASTRESFVHFFRAVSECSDVSSLLWPSAWQTAAVEALTMLTVGDGTLYALGALNHFNNNLVKDVLLIAVTWLGLVVFSVPFFGTIISSGIGTERRENIMWDINNITEFVRHLKRYPYVESVMHPLYYFQWTDRVSQYCGYVLFIVFFVVQLPAHVLMAENTVSIVLRLISRLQGLHKNVVRRCVMFVYYALLATAYSLSLASIQDKELVGHVVCLLVLPVIVWECLAVRYLYTVDRILVNMCTMFVKHPRAFQLSKSLTRPLYLLWGQLLPLLAGLLFLTAVLRLMRMISTNLLVVAVLLLAFLPLLVAGWTLVRLAVSKQERTHALFRPSPNWGPFTVKDKKSANHDERAARLFW